MHLLVLSKNRFLYSTRRIVTSALNSGCDVTLLDPRACVIGVDESGPVLLVDGEALSDIDMLLPRLAPSLVDESAPVMTWAEARGVPSLCSLASMRLAADKGLSAIALAEAKIPTPDSVLVSHSSQLPSALVALGGAPIVAKSMRGAQGKGVALLESAISAKSACEALLEAQGALLLQRFESDAEGKDVRAFVMEGKVIGAVERTAAHGDFRANVHQGGVGRVTRLTPEEELVALGAARALGLNHLAGVDLLRTQSGPKILEVNASPGIEGVEDVLKLDLAAQIVALCARIVSA